LLAGWLNSPHVLRWAQMLIELDYDVALVGHSASGWPRLEPPAQLVDYEEYELRRLPLVGSYELGECLRASVARLGPDLIHTHWLAEYGWLAARAGLHPLVSSAWGSDVMGAGWLGRRRARTAIRGADLLLADSAALASAVRALVPDGVRVEVFHPGVDLKRFCPRDPEEARGLLGWQSGIPIVLSPRALYPRYNPLTIIAAFARVRAELPTARLVLKHPGDSLPQDVQEAVTRSGVEANIDVVGHLDEDQLAHVYPAADVVVSVPSSDSSPATAWEALACARPLVVSDLPWARQELTHGESAWLTPIDEAALARALISLLRDRERARRLGDGGRLLACARMDRSQRLGDLDHTYRALLAGEPRRGRPMAK
jgi:glycosyltransferase involved in cell wall biosynthesis